MALGTTPQPPFDRPSWSKRLSPSPQAIVALVAIVALALLLAKITSPISGY